MSIDNHLVEKEIKPQEVLCCTVSDSNAMAAVCKYLLSFLDVTAIGGYDEKATEHRHHYGYFLRTFNDPFRNFQMKNAESNAGFPFPFCP